MNSEKSQPSREITKCVRFHFFPRSHQPGAVEASLSDLQRVGPLHVVCRGIAERGQSIIHEFFGGRDGSSSLYTASGDLTRCVESTSDRHAQGQTLHLAYSSLARGAPPTALATGRWACRSSVSQPVLVALWVTPSIPLTPVAPATSKPCSCSPAIGRQGCLSSANFR